MREEEEEEESMDLEGIPKQVGWRRKEKPGALRAEK